MMLSETLLITLISHIIFVLILVLVDDALWEIIIIHHENNDIIVLILVLVDDALWVWIREAKV